MYFKTKQILVSTSHTSTSSSFYCFLLSIYLLEMKETKINACNTDIKLFSAPFNLYSYR